MARSIIFTLLLSAGLTSCSSGANRETTTTSISADTDAESQELFRTIFAKNLRRACPAGYCTPQEISRAVYRVPERLLMEPTSADPLGELRKRVEGELPSQQFEHGAANPPTAFHLADIPPGRPVTLVIIPGIWGEFIEQLPFQETFEQGGTFGKRWRNVLARETDTVYSLQNDAQEPHSLAELVPVASIDGPTGSPQTNLLLLRALRGSLETLGTLDDNAQVYLRRLSKVFDLIPDSDTRDIYFVGYSRGLAVSLELLLKARANPSTYPWGQRVRGVVGLGGVYFGSETAEDVFYSANSTEHKLLGILNDLAADLETGPADASPAGFGSFWNILTAGDAPVWGNTRAWARAARRIAEIAAQNAFSPQDPGLAYELKHTAMTGAKPDTDGMLSLMQKIAFDTLKLHRPVARYVNNVKAFKSFVTESTEGIETLTVTSRRSWWSTHTLPADVKLFSLTGTMPDASSEQRGASPLFDFPGYGTDTADFKLTLRSAFYGLAKVSGTQLNDSQVTQYSSRYWRGVAARLNPAAPKLRHHFLGTVGTHHWGMAFPFAFQDGKGNSFPRTELIRSIGEFIARVQEE